MKRREFLKASLLGAAVAAVAPLDLLGGTKGRPKKGGAELKIMGLSASSPMGRVWRGASAS